MFWRKQQPEDLPRPGWTKQKTPANTWICLAGGRALHVIGGDRKDPWVYVVKDVRTGAIIHSGIADHMAWAMEGAESVETLPGTIKLEADDETAVDQSQWQIQHHEDRGAIYAVHFPTRSVFRMQADPDSRAAYPIFANYMAEISPFVPDEEHKRIYDLGKQAVRLYCKQMAVSVE